MNVLKGKTEPHERMKNKTVEALLGSNDQLRLLDRKRVGIGTFGKRKV
jgi:hypothetical protein